MEGNKLIKLDLETLKHVKSTFDIFSDHGTLCFGYRALCRMISEEELKTKDKNKESGKIDNGR